VVFLLNGGSSEALFHVWKNIAAVVQFTGEPTGNVPQSQQGLSLVTYMAGPRYSFLMPRRLTVYGQFLAGRMHGFDTYFPRDDVQPNGSANSRAFSTGGGVEIRIDEFPSRILPVFDSSKNSASAPRRAPRPTITA
jgi:outer membrane immunogenic protein